MEGFLNLQWPRWRRVLITRLIAIVPTFFVAFYSEMNDITRLNNFLNVVMSLQLPFAAIPTIAFTSNPSIMGREFVNKACCKVIAMVLSFLVILVNLSYMVVRVELSNLSTIWMICFALFLISYILFNLYLVIHLVVSMGNSFLYSFTFVQKYVMPCRDRNLLDESDSSNIQT